MVHEILLADQILQYTEDAEQEARRISLNKMDPFSLSDEKFINLFRLSKPLVRSRKGLGSYQEIIGSNSFVGISQSSVSRNVSEVCTALSSPEILNKWVHFPENIQEIKQLRRRFYQKYRFPGVIGSIDCTHVAITAPLTNDSVYPERI